MRNIKWLRYGLASTMLACGALGAFLVACGDDDSGVTATDAGNDNNVNPADTGGGGTDSGNDSGGDSGTIVPAKIIVVHAAHDYGDSTDPSGAVRVCYATKSASAADFAISPLPPLPHSVEDGGAATVPGIPIGAGGPFPSTGVPLETLSIRPYIVSAKALAERGVVGTTGIATSARCNTLLTNGFTPDGGFANDAGALVKDQDYWQLADIPANTFKNGKTYMLAIYGCAQNAADTNTGKCGPAAGGGVYAPDGGPGAGNLKVVVMELDATTTIANNEIGVQVANLSPEHAAANATVPAIVPKFEPTIINDIADSGPDGSSKYVGANGAKTEVPFNPAGAVTTMAKITGFVSNKGYFAVNDTPSSLNPTAPFVAIPMNNSAGTPPAVIQYIVEGKLSPNTAELYVNGKSYTFVLVGDPDTNAAGLRKIHFLGFPNVFEPKPAQ